MESERSNGNLDLGTGLRGIEGYEKKNNAGVHQTKLSRKRAAYVSTCGFGNQLLLFTFILRAFTSSVSQCCKHVAAQGDAR